MHVFPATAWTARDVYSELDENLFLSLDARGDGEPLTVLLAQAPRVVGEPPAPTRSVAMGPGPGPGPAQVAGRETAGSSAQGGSRESPRVPGLAVGRAAIEL